MFCAFVKLTAIIQNTSHFLHRDASITPVKLFQKKKKKVNTLYMNFWETIKAALRATPPKTDDTCTKFKAKKINK